MKQDAPGVKPDLPSITRLAPCPKNPGGHDLVEWQE